ncbi:hypothetical protein [Cobetia amphilecti]|uniref:hypothetical protein n=1 Tax=Cobetia amphilecti TaxID=1055104 RepID=UPI003296A97E
MLNAKAPQHIDGVGHVASDITDVALSVIALYRVPQDDAGSCALFKPHLFPIPLMRSKT